MDRQPTIEELFALNADAVWRESINCYGLAIGASIAEAKASIHTSGPHPGDLSAGYRLWQPHELGIHPLQQNHYLMLADGLDSIRAGEADTAAGHVIAACDYNAPAEYVNEREDYHFFRRVHPHLWIHKEGRHTPVTATFGLQATITNIHAAVLELIENNNGGRFIHFYQVPAGRPHVGDKSPPAYTPGTEKGLLTLLQESWLRRPDARLRIEDEATNLGVHTGLVESLQRNPHLKLFTNTSGTSRWLKSAFKP